MPIYVGTTELPAGALYGAREVYAGTTKIYPPATTPTDPDPPAYTFYDDFERTTIGTNWTGSGALIEAGELKKNNTNGSADYWTSRQFSTDDLDVTVVIGTVASTSEPYSILLGSSAQYVYVEQSANGGAIGEYDGSAWNTLASIPAGLASGDTIRVYRIGTGVIVQRNGSTIATAFSSVALGSAYRRVGLSVRRASDWLTTRYGPTIESVGVA